jgi:hypothetical protein
MKSTMFCHVSSCDMIEVYPVPEEHPLFTACFHGLLFNPENVSSDFVRNVRKLLIDIRHYILKDGIIHKHCVCKNLYVFNYISLKKQFHK